jgi:hypothetical protein
MKDAYALMTMEDEQVNIRYHSTQIGEVVLGPLTASFAWLISKDEERDVRHRHPLCGYRNGERTAIMMGVSALTRTTN